MAVHKQGGEIESQLTRSFLALENIDPNIYRASPVNLWKPVGGRAVFGGQVVGQALVAACNTVTENQHIHSLHCYFLRPGNANKHILYHVDRTRDGTTYCSRAIKATQDSVPIFTMQTSFKVDEVDPLKHQYTMPQVPPPEELMSSDDFIRMQMQSDEVSAFRKMIMSSWLDNKIHVEKRPVDPEVYHYNRPGEPRRLVWVRAIGEIGDSLKMHQCVAGFISDIALLGAATQPASTDITVGFMASLDHSIWFHTSFRADEWMLYDIQCPQCGAGKAFVQGRIWRRDGVLAISTAQEGVVRTVKATEKDVLETKKSTNEGAVRTQKSNL